MITAQEALQRLRDGNARFVAGNLNSKTQASPARRDELVEAQQPFAIILGCSDSRVPAELVFDQGLGDLFVIRVAGNVVAPSGIGSIEYCASMFGTQLVIVLGHSRCGAVQATLEQLTHSLDDRSPNLASIVGRISPAVGDMVDQERAWDDQALGREAEIANIHQSVAQLQHGSEIIENLVQSGTLEIIGAHYALDTGIVEFLD